MSSRIRFLLLTGFTAAVVKCTAQEQIQPDGDAAKTKAEVIFIQPLTRASNKSEPAINLSSLKGMSSLMSYDAKMGSTTNGGPLHFDYAEQNLRLKAAKIDARNWRLGIEQAERMNLMQMNEYRLRNAPPNSNPPKTLQPLVPEKFSNPK